MPKYRMLGVLVTPECPNRCGICGAVYEKGVLPTGTIKRCIEQASSIGIGQVGLTGGEPVGAPQTLEILDYASSMGIACGLTTSAWYANSRGEGERTANTLVDHGLDNIRISCDPDHADSVNPKNWVYAINGARNAGLNVELNMVFRRSRRAESEKLFLEMVDDLGGVIEVPKDKRIEPEISIGDEKIVVRPAFVYNVGRARNLDSGDFYWDRPRPNEKCENETLMLTNKGELLHCCTLHAAERQDVYSLGNINSIDLVTAVQRRKSSPIGMFVEDDGLHSLVKILKKSDDPDIRRLADAKGTCFCDTCVSVFSNDKASRFVYEMLKN